METLSLLVTAVVATMTVGGRGVPVGDLRHGGIV